MEELVIGLLGSSHWSDKENHGKKKGVSFVLSTLEALRSPRKKISQTPTPFGVSILLTVSFLRSL